MKSNKNFIIKICGIRNEASVRDVFKYKPKMIGLIFVPDSIRLVDKKTAQKIAEFAQRHGILVVGIFQNQPLSKVLDFIKSVPLDYVQLHGQEDSSYCRQISIPIIKKITLQDTVEETKTLMSKYRDIVNLFLIDREKQGQGSLVNMDTVQELSREYRILIAGGLNKDNVDGVIQKIGRNLTGVDTSSGVEHIAGEKDEGLVNSFIQEARRSYESL